MWVVGVSVSATGSTNLPPDDTDKIYSLGGQSDNGESAVLFEADRAFLNEKKFQGQLKCLDEHMMN